MKNRLLIMFITMFAIVQTASAQKPALMLSEKEGWHKIAENTVNFEADKDELVVIGADKFNAIRLKVTQSAIHIEDVEIYYENGGKKDVKLNMDIKQGEESKVIELNGPKEVKKVVLVYNSLPNMKQEKAHVEIYGLK